MLCLSDLNYTVRTCTHTYISWQAVEQFVEVLRYKPEGRGFDSPTVSMEVFIDIKSFRTHYGLGVDPASNINEYQEYFLGVKAAGA